MRTTQAFSKRLPFPVLWSAWRTVDSKSGRTKEYMVYMVSEDWQVNFVCADQPGSRQWRSNPGKMKNGSFCGSNAHCVIGMTGSE